jgi:hypothetical protein
VCILTILQRSPLKFMIPETRSFAQPPSSAT